MKRQAYTLVEMLVVTAIISLLVTAIFNLLSLNSNTLSSGYDRQTVENQAIQGLDKMVRELYDTNRARIFITGESITFMVPIGYEYVNDIGQIAWGAQGNKEYKIKYFVNNTTHQLVRQILGATNDFVSQSVLAVNIQSVNFVLTGDMLTITLVAQEESFDRKAASGQRTITQAFSSNVTFRN